MPQQYDRWTFDPPVGPGGPPDELNQYYTRYWDASRGSTWVETFENAPLGTLAASNQSGTILGAGSNGTGTAVTVDRGLIDGQRSIKFFMTASTTFLRTINIGSTTGWWASTVVQYSVVPTSAISVALIARQGTTNLGGVGTNASGQFVLRNGATTQTPTAPNLITVRPGQIYQIVWNVVGTTHSMWIFDDTGRQLAAFTGQAWTTAQADNIGVGTNINGLGPTTSTISFDRLAISTKEQLFPLTGGPGSTRWDFTPPGENIAPNDFPVENALFWWTWDSGQIVATDGTFDTLAGNATADGGVSSFGVDVVFDTLVGDAPAAGGSTTFTGDAAFDTVVGSATADGGTTSFSVDASFTTVVGNAPADGGSTSFTGGASFDTVVGDAPAAGGSTSFTGTGTFDSLVGTATAAGGSTSFTGNGTFDTVVGAATADGGVTTFTVAGDATFDTLAGTATADGGSTSMSGGSEFLTLVGDAPAAGGSTSFAGGAEFATLVGVATADGGVSTFSGTGGGTAEFLTLVGVATAGGGETSFLVTTEGPLYFIPPVVIQRIPQKDKFWEEVSGLRSGVSVLITEGVAVERQWIRDDEIRAADFYYGGGTATLLSDSEVELLTSLGYGDCISSDRNPPSSYYESRGR